jgi:hypothetical protein
MARLLPSATTPPPPAAPGAGSRIQHDAIVRSMLPVLRQRTAI